MHEQVTLEEIAVLHAAIVSSSGSLSLAGSRSACSPKRSSRIPCSASITFSRASARVRPWLIAPGTSGTDAMIHLCVLGHDRHRSGLLIATENGIASSWSPRTVGGGRPARDSAGSIKRDSSRTSPRRWMEELWCGPVTPSRASVALTNTIEGVARDHALVHKRNPRPCPSVVRSSPAAARIRTPPRCPVEGDLRVEAGAAVGRWPDLARRAGSRPALKSG